jgi:hypothetical protein
VALHFDGKLEWDSAKMRFTNNSEATEMVKPKFRKGWLRIYVNLASARSSPRGLPGRRRFSSVDGGGALRAAGMP